MDSTNNLKILQKIRPEVDFGQSIDFIADGLLDSFDLIALVSDLDQTFSISIDGVDIVPENFQNLDKIIQLIQKSGAAGEF